MAAAHTCLLFCAAMAATAAAAAAAAAAGAAECEPGKLACSLTCREIEFCTERGPLVVDTCPEGTVCRAATVTCEEGSQCPTRPTSDKFECHDLGFFPDPYDCTRYHFCAEVGHLGSNEQCPASTSYSALTGRCSLPADSDACAELPIPRCEHPGEAGAQRENPNIYFVCVNTAGTLEPWLFKCPSALEFDGARCTTPTPSSTTATPSSTTATPSSTTATPSSTTASPTSSATTTAAGAGGFKCPGMGQYPDMTDCRKYFVCLSDLEAREAECDDGYRFVRGKGCVRGACPVQASTQHEPPRGFKLTSSTKTRRY